MNPLAEFAARISDAPLAPDRGGYTLTMRECAGSEEALAFLEQEQPQPDRLHLGWGSFRNLDLVAARRSAAALLLDVNVHQLRVWEAVRAALIASADAPEFIEEVVPQLPHTPRLRQFADTTLGWLRGDLERSGSWLCEAHPERFRHVRGLFAAGRVATASLDLRGGGQGSRRFDLLAHELQATRHDAGAGERACPPEPLRPPGKLGRFGDAAAGRRQSRQPAMDDRAPGSGRVPRRRCLGSARIAAEPQ